MDPSEVTVLVVEDDEFTRMATIDILKSCRYTVFAVENGQQALDVLVANHAKFDLVLCDVMLPVMTGIELLDEIQKLSATLGHIPIVMTSSNEEMDVVTSCQQRFERLPNQANSSQYRQDTGPARVAQSALGAHVQSKHVAGH